MAQVYSKLVQEDLNVGTDEAWVCCPGSGQLRSTQMGVHSVGRGQTAWEATWAPGAIAAGSYVSTTMTVTTAYVRDHVMVSHDKILTSALRISGHVTARDVVTVVIHNPTAAAITVPSGTVRAVVFEQCALEATAGAAPNPVDAGVDVTFTPTLAGGLAPYTYQWVFEVDTLWDDLVLYYNFNEASGTRRDARGEIHLLEVGATGSVAGKGGNAASFDPAGDHYLQSAQQANISGVNGITFTCWLNIRTGAPTNAAWFKNGEVFTSYMLLNTQASNARLISMTFYDDLGGGSTAGELVSAFDTWYFVCAKFDPATLKTSISIDDGAFTLAAVAASTYPTINTGFGNGRVDVGGTARGGVRSKSFIDEIGLWSRVLTAGEITSLYAAGAGKFYPGSTEETPVYAYPTAGTKVASLTVTSSSGCTASDTVDVTVNASTLAVTFAMDPDPLQQSVDKDTLITFTPTVTPGVAPYTYDWDWGDGEAHGVTEIPTHTYDGNPLGGTYIVLLTVTDAALATATKSQSIDIAGV